jgi:hypothetical protein
MRQSWNDMALTSIVFQQDVIRAHTARTPDFLACDYWTYLTSKVHINHCRNITKLEQNIREETAATEVGVTWQVIQHLLSTV